MDWPKDSACLSQNKSALKKVFKFIPSASLVIEILHSSCYEARAYVLTTDAEWEVWAESIDHNDRGLILILATRAGCEATLFKGGKPIPIDDWIENANKYMSTPFETRRAQILSPLAEKPPTVDKPISRGIRTVPFSQPTFEFLASRMQIHESITRTISRSDIATFTVDEVNMHKPALVYNCRTSNAWDMDLALSQTHYPHTGLSLSVLYGCDLCTNREVIKRLQLVGQDATHPLLIPGIFAEIELSRQISIVETGVIAVETKILELDIVATKSIESPSLEPSQKRVDKRSAWLDLAYLRDALVNWNTQLFKMADHVDEVDGYIRQELHPKKTQEIEVTTPTEYVPYSLQSTRSTLINTTFDAGNTVSEKPVVNTCEPERRDGDSCDISSGNNSDVSRMELKESSVSELPIPSSMKDTNVAVSCKCYSAPRDPRLEHCGRGHVEPPCYHHPSIHGGKMNIGTTVGKKIKRRLLVLQTEFDEMIRSCTMRLDGMAMATQWSHSETNVEIASATRRDSRIMKSISLVTMIFLPGTFFATVFSMTFFDWFGDSSSGKKLRVSSYVWIYIVITAVFTAVTVATWYYFVILRRRFKVIKIISSVV